MAVAAFALLGTMLLAFAADFPKDYHRAQTSRAEDLVRLLCPERSPPIACARARELPRATSDDNWFVLGYVLLGTVAALSLTSLRTWSRSSTSRGVAGNVAAGLVVAGGACDLVENRLVHAWAGRLVDRAPFDSVPSILVALGDGPNAMLAAGALKWGCLGGAIVLVLWSMLGPPLATARPCPVYSRPKLDPEHPWDPPVPGQERLGICCSGGGIRSAAFSLGALQALRQLPKRKPLLPRAEYLAAVSGGGYIAAGLAVAEATTKNHDPPVFSPGSAEERHFRDNSSYLVPDLQRGAVGVARLLLGLVVNVLVVWLVLYVVARPVGWAIGELHKELRPAGPVALTPDPVPALRVAAVSPVACAPGAPCTGGEGGTRPNNVIYEVVLAAATDADDLPDARDESTGTLGLDLAPFDLDRAEPECTYTVTDQRLSEEGARTTVFDERRTAAQDKALTARRGLVAVKAEKAEVVRQPVVEVVAPGATTGDARCIQLARTLEVDRQPELSLRSDAAGMLPTDLLSELRVSTQPRVRSATGLRGRDDITVETWMWVTCALVGAAALGLHLALVVLRPSGRWRSARGTSPRSGKDPPPNYRERLKDQLGARRTVLLWPAVACTVVAIGLFLLLVGLPWLTQELPGWLESLSDAVGRTTGATGSGLQDYLLPGGGAVFLSVTALRRYLAGAPDTDDGRKKADAPGPLTRVWRWLSGRSKELSWYELSPAKVLLGILLAVSTVVLFVESLQYASANGPGGRLMGMAFVRDKLPYSMWRPEWQRYLLVLGVLVVFERLFDAHAWSLNPFYKRRLSSAYLEGPRLDNQYDDHPICFHHELKRPTGFPQLVVGCAVNLSEVGRVPPGRRAASFTFSSTEIGGPVVGYVGAESYWNRMRRGRRKDITVPAAMAISGAAFSPAMGKKNLGPVGSIMALANLRLGVWLPHPQYVEKSTARSWIHRPGWTWFLRELLNRYRFDEPYLYVSDGGHWENLGLVELLRRGCTTIVCINAGGDSQLAFGTIGEAIALAREELNVEFYDFDPSPLRPPPKAREDGRLLRRAVARDRPEPLATASYVRGRFRYRNRDDREGRIWLIEPALTADMPFDVHVFAESEAIFPDDSTADQVFNHRQFEAFRALGFHQAAKAAADPWLRD